MLNVLCLLWVMSEMCYNVRFGVNFYSFTEMVVPDVDKSLLEQLELMGFPLARATRALHYSGKPVILLFRAPT